MTADILLLWQFTLDTRLELGQMLRHDKMPSLGLIMQADLSGLGCCSDTTCAPLLLAAIHHSICCHHADLQDADLPGQRTRHAITGVPSGDAALTACTEQASIAMDAHSVQTVTAGVTRGHVSQLQPNSLTRELASFRSAESCSVVL